MFLTTVRSGTRPGVVAELEPRRSALADTPLVTLSHRQAVVVLIGLNLTAPAARLPVTAGASC